MVNKILTLKLSDDSGHREDYYTWPGVAVSESEEHTLRTLLANLISVDELITGLRELDGPRTDGVLWEIADRAEEMDLPLLTIENP